MNRIFRIFGICLTLLAIIFFIIYTIQHASSLPSIEWSFTVIIGFGIAILIYILVILSGGIAWHLLVNAIGESTSLLTSLRIFVLAQFAKYIPGNIAHYLGRISLARSAGFSLSNVVFSMTLEFGLLIFSSAIIAIGSLSSVGPEFLLEIPEIPPAWLFLILAFVAILIPSFWSLVVFRLRPGSLKKYLGNEDQRNPSLQVLLLSIFFYLIGYVLLGLVLDIIVRIPFNYKHSNLWILTGIYSIAWLTGYITPGAPAGLGVRDTILVAALSLIYDPGLALGITFSMRVITAIGDGLGFLTGLGLRKWSSDPVMDLWTKEDDKR
jgi:hypothetical protein